MHFLATSIKKELLHIARDPAALAMWLGIPLMLITVLNLAFGGAGSQGPRPQGVLFLVDHDNSFVSRMAASTFTQQPLSDVFRLVRTDETAGRRRMAKGEGSALIILPRGLEDHVLRNRPITIRLVTNPSQRILPAIAAESLVILSDAVHYLHMVAGEEIIPLATGNASAKPGRLLAIAQAIDRTAASIRRYLDPPLIDFQVQSAKPASAGPSFNLLAAFFPGMAFLSILFLTRGTSHEIWNELQQGTLRRLQTTGAPVSALLFSKLAAVLATTAAVAVMSLSLGQWQLPGGIANFPAALLWMVAGGAAWHLLLTLCQLFTGAPNRGDILASLIVFPSMMLGGSMFSFSMMPETLARIAKLTPLGWMVAQFDQIIQGKATATEIGLGLAGMIAASVILFAAAQRRLLRAFLKD